jgi:thioredoxin reductase
VAYRLLEPENIADKKVIVVGGGDSAIEAALALIDHNKVILSYRSEAFSRLKPKNREKLDAAVQEGKIDVKLQSNLSRIEADKVFMNLGKDAEPLVLENDLVYIFAGGELPTDFLKKAGVEISKRHGYTMKKHK